MAGYSKRPLLEKLGIKPGFAVAIVDAPEGYAATLGDLPESATLVAKPRAGLDFIHLFSKQRRALDSKFRALKGALKPNGMMWVSWPKGSSGVETDLSDNVVREIGLKNGLVDVKVCAVDETWSGLKFVYRLKDRS